MIGQPVTLVIEPCLFGKRRVAGSSYLTTGPYLWCDRCGFIAEAVVNGTPLCRYHLPEEAR